MLPAHSLAEAEADPRFAQALAIQTAMSRAKEHLQANRPAEAVAVLEKEILHLNGNENYLALMKSAYVAYLKDLKRTNGSADRIEHARRQLRILDPQLNVDEIAVAAEIPPPAEKPRPAVARAQADDDPFQQAPLDRIATTDVKVKAKRAFEQQRYAEAAGLFGQAFQAGLTLTPEERQAWGYCRLSEVVTRLNQGGEPKSSLAGLQKETEEAIQLGGPTLAKFGEQVLAAIRKRQPSAEQKPTAESAPPAGWQVSETASFRVFVQQARPQAEAVAKVAEQRRTAAFEKWSGPAGNAWSPRCDIWLHQTGEEYTKATHQPAASPGHASVGAKDGRVHNRRIDLRLDDAGVIETTLPREIAFVVLADLFPEQPLPRWAVVGMSILAEPPAEVSRYLRTVPRFTQEKKLLAVRDLLALAEFPAADKITPFYVESVSLVDYLVRLKGPRAFALYLREAPRRGYEEALQRHYGIKDAADLQERWMKFALKGE
jgi:hypothetical protein